jgi:ABC-type polysaccharide/polyol phosphate export permease
MIHGLYRYRSFIWRHAVTELRHRYAGTGLGVVWNVLHPLALIAVYSLVFTRIMTGGGGDHVRRPVPGVPEHFAFVLYLCSGLLPWLAFSECVARGCNAFSDNANYLKKLPIPEQVFVAQSAASATMGLVISFSLLLAVSLLLGLQPTWHWLLLPLPLASLQLLGFGLGLLCGTLNVFFRDIAQLLGITLQVVMWTAPVVYPAEILPRAVQPLLKWHPLVPTLTGTRELFLYRQLPDAGYWVGMVVWPTIALLVAWGAFRKLRAEIRDLL